MEHISIKQAVDYVMNYPKNNLAATITAHHLLYNLILFSGWITTTHVLFTCFKERT